MRDDSDDNFEEPEVSKEVEDLALSEVHEATKDDKDTEVHTEVPEIKRKESDAHIPTYTIVGKIKLISSDSLLKMINLKNKLKDTEATSVKSKAFNS